MPTEIKKNDSYLQPLRISFKIRSSEHNSSRINGKKNAVKTFDAQNFIKGLLSTFLFDLAALINSAMFSQSSQRHVLSTARQT